MVYRKLTQNTSPRLKHWFLNSKQKLQCCEWKWLQIEAALDGTSTLKRSVKPLRVESKNYTNTCRCTTWTTTSLTRPRRHGPTRLECLHARQSVVYVGVLGCVVAARGMPLRSRDNTCVSRAARKRLFSWMVGRYMCVLFYIRAG